MSRFDISGVQKKFPPAPFEQLSSLLPMIQEGLNDGRKLGDLEGSLEGVYEGFIEGVREGVRDGGHVDPG